MEKSKDVITKPKRTSRILIMFMVIISLLVVWHFYLSIGLNSHVRSLQSAGSDSDQKLSTSVNPLTNLVSLMITMPPELDEDNPFAALGSALEETIIQTFGPNFIERELNTRAREQYDLYVALIPYRVRIMTETASADTIRNYITSHLSLEGIRVAPGEQLGREVDCVFGTIVNGGQHCLHKVTIRVYFLNSSGRRIGEKDFSPVLVTDLTSLRDYAPLRPGCRKDFVFNVEEDAPSGWNKRVEAEIMNIKFSGN